MGLRRPDLLPTRTNNLERQASFQYRLHGTLMSRRTRCSHLLYTSESLTVNRSLSISVSVANLSDLYESEPKATQRLTSRLIIARSGWPLNVVSMFEIFHIDPSSPLTKSSGANLHSQSVITTTYNKPFKRAPRISLSVARRRQSFSFSTSTPLKLTKVEGIEPCRTTKPTCPFV